MTLQQMEYIMSIAKFGSFSKAASNLYMSQSALSLSVKELEKSLGITIFERTNRGVRLTSDGELYLVGASDILSKVGSLEDFFLHRQLPARYSVSTQRLAFSVKAFSRIIQDSGFAASDIAIRECHTYAVIQDVASGRSNIGIIALSESNGVAVLSELESKGIGFTELESLLPAAFMSSTHPLARKSFTSLSELNEYTFVTYDQEVGISRYTEEPVFYGRFRKHIHVSDRSTKLALIRTGSCFSIELDLPNNSSLKEASGKNIKWSRICSLPVSELDTPFRIVCLMRRGYTPDAADLKYMDVLHDEIRKLQKKRKRYSRSPA